MSGLGRQVRLPIGSSAPSEKGECADDDQDGHSDLANAEKSDSPERGGTRRLGGIEPEPSLKRGSYASSWVSCSSSRCRPYLPSDSRSRAEDVEEAVANRRKKAEE